MDKSTMAMEGSAPSAPPPLNSGVRHVTSRPRSRSPQHLGPWVPPPAKSTKGSKYAWMVTVPFLRCIAILLHFIKPY